MTQKINLTILGTSTGIPTARRNHSAILLEYSGENILVDCGEGTQRQMRKAGLNPCKITKILITHTHGDHILGLPGLLQTLNLSECKNKIIIYCPRHAKHKIESIIDLLVIGKTTPIEIHEVSGKFYENKEFYLEAVELSHGIPTNGYAFVKKDKTRLDRGKLKKLKLPNSPLLGELQRGKDIIFNGKKIKAKDITYFEKGKKISFVFDTVFNESCVRLAKDSDLVIAEATYMENSEKGKELAKLYQHLTASQAAQITKSAKAKKLILTHISQRYEVNAKRFIAEARKKFKDTVIAEDLMKIEI